MEKPSTTVDFKDFLKNEFPGSKFRTQDLKVAGKHYKISPDKTREYLKEQLKTFGELPPNFSPPAKCRILFTSSDVNEWPLMRLSKAIQEHVYNATQDTFNNWIARYVETSKYPKKLQSQEEHLRWFEETQVPDFGLRTGSTQYVNAIFKKTLNIYSGIIKKVDNRNKKRKERFGDDFEPESAFNENGQLLDTSRPGINSNIYCVQQSKLQLLTQKLIDRKELVVDHRINTTLSIGDIIPSFGYFDRLKIKDGEPGYIPQWQRELVKPSRKVRRYWKSSDDNIQNAIPLIVFIGTEWVIIDGRGLLRDARRRKLANKETTYQELLDMFSNDPVIDVNRNVVTFSYVEGIVPVRSFIPIGEKKGKERLQEVSKDKPVGVLSIDIGQINPVSAGVYRVHQLDTPTQSIDLIGKFLLDQKYLDDIKKYRILQDSLEADILNEAVDLFDENHKQEYLRSVAESTDDVKKKLCTHFGINPDDLDWKDMHGSSTSISDYLVDKSKATIADVSFDANGKQIKLNNYRWYRKFAFQISKEARESLNKNIWEIKCSSPKYKKLSVRKREIARSIANFCVSKAKKDAAVDDVYVVIERLTKDNKTMSGSGKRDVGWHNFGTRKKENRWFIQAISSAFEDKAIHHGTPIFKVSSAFTSQTCPKCGHCDKESRSKENREVFVCTSCSAEMHSDLDVATHNIAYIAFTGERLKGPSSGVKIPKKKTKS